MNIVVVAGRVASAPRCTDLPSGEVRWSFDLARRASSDEPAWSVPVVCCGSVEGGAASSLRAGRLDIAALDVGAEVTVVGSVRRRFFRVGGATQSRTEVVAVDVVPRRAIRRTRRVLQAASDSLGVVAGGEVSSSTQRAGVGRRTVTRREQES